MLRSVRVLRHTHTHTHTTLLGHLRCCALCRYSDAARLRDLLADLERRAKRAEALAAEFKPTAAAPRFRLGQRVKHRKHGYRWATGEAQAWLQVGSGQRVKHRMHGYGWAVGNG